MVEVRGTVHWLTHADGPARALSVNPNARARLPRILGTTGKVAWITDAGGGDAIQIAEIEPESAATVRTITSVDLGNVTQLVASPDGEKLAAASHDGRLLLVDVESGEVTELAANDDGDIEDVSWSPDSAWLAWAQPGPQPLARIRLARVEDGFTVDVTDGRFVDSDPVFTVDGLYLAFLSRRTFDPIYDAHSFDLSFPFGARPYLVPLAAHTLSPFGPLPGGRPVGNGENSKDSSERVRLTVDTDGISSRVVAVPVDEARYYSLAAAKGGLLWLRYPLVRRARRGHRGPGGRAPQARARAVRPAQARGERARGRGELVRGQRRRRPAGDRRPRRRARRPVRPQGRQRLVRRRGQRGPDPRPVPGRPGGAVAARVRGVRAAAAPGLLDADHVRTWTGTASSRSTASCSTGCGPRPSSATCSGRSPASSARRTPTSCRPARSRPGRRCAASPPRSSAPTWPAPRTGAGSWSGCCPASRPTRGPARRSPPRAWPSGRATRSSRSTAARSTRCTARGRPSRAPTASRSS